MAVKFAKKFACDVQVVPGLGYEWSTKNIFGYVESISIAMEGEVITVQGTKDLDALEDAITRARAESKKMVEKEEAAYAKGLARLEDED